MVSLNFGIFLSENCVGVVVILAFFMIIALSATVYERDGNW